MAGNTAAMKRSRVCKHGGKGVGSCCGDGVCRLQWWEMGGLMEGEWVAVTEMV